MSCDGAMSDLVMPVGDDVLASVSKDLRGFSAGEEGRILSFMRKISVGGVEFPLDDGRLVELERVGERTTRREDVAIARWLIGIKKLIEEVRR